VIVAAAAAAEEADSQARTTEPTMDDAMAWHCRHSVHG